MPDLVVTAVRLASETYGISVKSPVIASFVDVFTSPVFAKPYLQTGQRPKICLMLKCAKKVIIESSPFALHPVNLTSQPMSKNAL